MVELARSPLVTNPSPMPLVVPFTRTHIHAEARRAVLDVLASGWVTSGEQVVAFEDEFGAHVGADHAVAVSSCTAGLELALRALELPRGAKVLMSTMTFCGAAFAIEHAGLLPVLADVDPLTAMPNPETTAAAAQAAGGVDAMVVVHLGGQPADVESLAASAGLDLDWVVEDAAHALGTAVGGAEVGTISRATCFSFYATKNLPIGEGGMVTTSDAWLADRLRRTRLHGMSADAWRRYLPGGTWRYDVDVDGLKANMTDLQAAIGRAQLRHFRRSQERRSHVADHYDARLAHVPGLRLPSRPATGRHAWHLYAVRITPEFGHDRDQVIVRLRERGIGTSVHFIPVHQLSWFRGECITPPAGFPGADAVFAETLSLPMDQVIADHEVDAVCDALADIGAA